MTNVTGHGDGSIGGLIPVLVCPYTPDDEIDVEGLRTNVEFLVDFAEADDRDVMLLTNGSLSECYANTLEEQRTMIEVTIAESNDVPVIAGVSQAGTKATVDLAESAAAAGADFVMVTPPYYHTPTAEGLYEHYRAVAEAIDVGVVVYNNPDVTGTWIRPDLMRRLSRLDNVVAAKENSDVTARNYAETRAIDPEDMTLVCGMGHSSYVAKASLGHRYRGFVSTIGNFAPGLAYDLYEAVEASDFDRAYDVLGQHDPFWNCVEDFMNRRESTSLETPGWEANYMYQSATKVAMELVGLDAGDVRLPMVNVTDEERTEIATALERMGVL